MKKQIVMPASDLYFRDREMSNRITLFILITVLIGALLGAIFFNNNGKKKPSNVNTNKASVDTIK